MIYQEGKAIALGSKVATTSLKWEHEYIFEYGFPKFALSLMSPETISSLAKKWVSAKTFLTREKEGDVFRIEGVRIDTDQGKIWVRGTTAPKPVIETQEAGVNPLAILAVIGTILAAIGLGVTLLFAYEVGTEVLGGGGSNTGSQVDPCTTGGVLDTVRCWARKFGYVALGAGVGIAITVVILLVLIGRREDLI